MECCTEAGMECRIICTQPRRLAAISIANRVSQERNDTLGKSVGYQIRLDSRISPTSNLVFTTSGYLLRCMTGTSNSEVFKTITHLILDEVHEREKTTDFLLIAIRDAVKVNPHLKVILMSATIDSELFSGYFDNCPVINVPGRLFDVNVQYLDDILYSMKYSSKKMREFMVENSMPKGLENDAAENGEQSEPQGAENVLQPLAHDLPDDEIEFYDECLEECVDGDDESTFDQICYLISDENMPSDYAHSSTGRTAMGIAAEKGFDSAINKLLSLGAGPTHRDNSGKTPIDYATANGHDFCLEVMQQFVDAMPAKAPVKVLQPTVEGALESNRRAVKHFTLIAYQLTNKKPAEIDHELLFELVSHIHASKPYDGSILVFLPGYEDIMAQKELIETRARFTSYELFVLHSGVNGANSTEQMRVFDAMPTGIRKIILATNIAETSLTINDVVYVIDAGKVKQQTYDSVGGATCLRSVDISQACAKQRAGRAGRLRNGFCYRLYSTEQFDAMDAYTLPELLRVSLSEICLNARILAPSEMSIEGFLTKALQPPALNNIRTSIAFLKQIDALDANERITQLGLHLANMPVDCQLGKAVLYGVLMQCLDPVLTIVSALSVKDPFLLPLGDEAEQIVKLKKEFADNSLSDHRMLLSTYSQWSNLRPKQAYEFCRANFICYGNMQMIQGIRRLILGHLNSAGILSRTIDPKTMNKNSDRWGVVKACLAAGIYPNICRINEFTGGIWSRQDAKLLPHLSSVLRDRKSKSQLDPDASASGAEWMIHGEKSRIARYSLIRDISCIPSIIVALFTGSMMLKCTFESLDGNAMGHYDEERDEDFDDLDVDDLDDLDIDDGADHELVNRISAMSLGVGDNEEFIDDGGFDTEMKIDDWISFSLDSREAQLLYGLRQKFMAVAMRFLKNPAQFRASNDEMQTLRKIVDVIQKEDNIEKALRKIAEKRENDDNPYPKKKQRQPTMTKTFGKHVTNAPSSNNKYPVASSSSAAYMSETYTTAVTTKQKRRNKGRSNFQPNFQPNQRAFNGVESWRDQCSPRTPIAQSNTPHQKLQISPDAQQKLFNALSGVDDGGNQPMHSLPETARPNPTYRKPKLFSTPKTSQNSPSCSTSSPSTQQKRGAGLSNRRNNHIERYFIVGVEHMGILKKIWKNRTEHWPFVTPIDEFRNYAMGTGGQPMKIILFFHVKQNGTSHGYCELRISERQYSFQTRLRANATGGRQWFAELP